jgi:ABC-type glycerol-3-phosphate transport system substrate-binding protein
MGRSAAYLRPARGRGLMRLKWAAILAAALVLVGCGGGTLCPAANHEPTTSAYRNCLVPGSPGPVTTPTPSVSAPAYKEGS